jgi:hypothetical protein
MRRGGLLLLCFAARAMAQTDVAPPPVNPLAVKQQMIEDRLARLEDRMFRLRGNLEKTEPDNARKLADALQRAGQLDLKSRVEALTTLLNKTDLQVAADEQDALLKDLESMLDVLLDRNPSDTHRAEEMKQMTELKQDLDRLIEEQRAAREAAGDAVRAQRLAAQVEAAAKRLKDLLSRQEQLSADSKSGNAADSAADQKHLSDEAKRLADDVERLAKEAAELKSGDKKPETPQENAEKSAEKPSDQGGEPPSAGDPSSGEQSDQQKSSGQQGSNDQKPKSAEQLKAAGEDLRKGAEKQQSAAEKLGADDKPGASEEQKAAEQEFRRAIHRLEEQQKELEKAADSAQRESEQRQLAERARKMAQRMQPGGEKGKEGGDQKSQDGKPQDGKQGGKQQDSQGQKGQQGQKGKEGQQGDKGDKQNQQKPAQKPMPGQDDVERAAPHMDRAADELKEEQEEQAALDQDKALDELERASRELEEALKQTRLEEQEERLRGLQSRLEDMLVKQTAINVETTPLSERGAENFERADALKCAELAGRQDEQVKAAEDCTRLLEEDGTTVVFPAVFRQLGGDMTTVAGRLRDAKVGPLTIGMQKEIQKTLADLVEAMKKLREKKKEQKRAGGAGGGAGAPGEGSLVPTSAELKMLKQAQLRVNSVTQTVAEARAAGEETEADLHDSLLQASTRQEELRTMARDIQDRVDKERGQ